MAIIFEGFGNVLNHEAQTVTCPVNTVGVMGAGLARVMRNRIPGLNRHYKDLCNVGDLMVGKCFTYEVPNQEDKQVLIFPSKEDWKDDSKVEFIESGLQYLLKNYKKLNITSLAIIPVGCGLGKLDYAKQVKPLFDKYLNQMDIDVYILHRDFE